MDYHHYNLPLSSITVTSSYVTSYSIQPPLDFRLLVRTDLSEYPGDRFRPEHEAYQREEDLVCNVGVQTPGRGHLHCPGQTQADDSEGLEEED